MNKFRISNNVGARVAHQMAVSGAPHLSIPAGAKRVEVNSFYFASNSKIFPHRITIDNKRYSFNDGLRVVIKRGDEIVRLFTMTDGLSNYRILQENDKWLLTGRQPV